MIVCGWCGKATANRDRCTTCGHIDPERPYLHRGEFAPVIRTDAVGRPALDLVTVRKRLAAARDALGPSATVAAIAEHLEVSDKTVRRWRQMTR